MAQYIFGQSSDGNSGKTQGSYFIIGRVKSIVLGPQYYDGANDPNYRFPSDIGKISYEILYTNINLSKANSTAQAAYPIFSAIKQFPLVSEIVLIVPGPDSDLNDSINRQGYYYFPPYSLWNSVNHNAFPNMEEYAEYLKQYYTQPQVEGSNGNKSVPDLPVGTTFSESENIKQLRVFEGDTILEGRFGQSIRFGSSVVGSSGLNSWSKSSTAGTPITIIRNGQGEMVDPDKFKSITEDLNRDDSSIWLTSGQELQIDNFQRFPMKSFDRWRQAQSRPNTIKKLETVSNTRLGTSAIEQDNKALG